ncbi:MAG: hypothetical protein VXV96_07525 [Bdellovibrionota bacterium]|nr:hypothetical protein [Bdellovibrionota bacterium]
MKKNIFSILLVLLMISVGCAQSKGNLKSENQDFYSLAKRAKSELKGKAYKDWLNKMLERKRGELAGLSGAQDRETRVLTQHEVMEESSALNGNQQDIHGFKAQSSRQSLHKMQERRKLVERHIFYLNSQLSELENTPNP